MKTKDLFEHAISGLLQLCKRLCSNSVSETILFIKCYNNPIKPDTVNQNPEDEYNAFFNKQFYSFADIYEDILTGLNYGLYMVDLTLFYSSKEKTVITVHFLSSDHKESLSYHVRIRRPNTVSSEGLFDLNQHIYSYCERKHLIVNLEEIYT